MALPGHIEGKIPALKPRLVPGIQGPWIQLTDAFRHNSVPLLDV